MMIQPLSGVARDLRQTTIPLDPHRVRADFPIMAELIHGRPLVYLDTAASAQKPRAVIDAMSYAYEHDYANVHRGVHLLSQRATDAFEAARTRVARFVNAASTDEIVFVRGATEALNLVASGLGRSVVQPGDEIILSHLEHHSNIVPWQMVRDATGAVIRVVPINDRGELDLDAYRALLGPRTRIVAMTHVSNALGTITPIEEICRLGQQAGAIVVVDGCQAAPHRAIDVRAIGADFYAFSGHKIYGPSGIGVLYGKMDRLRALPPYQGGGEMIFSVTFERSTFKEPPHRFEAGTPPIVEAIGLGAAVDYLTGLGLDAVQAHEEHLLDYAMRRIGEVPGVTLYGTAQRKAGILSFTLDGVHAHDVGTILDRCGVAVRVGHHCAQPIMDRFGVAATIRASFGVYNTKEDVDALIDGLGKVKEIFN